MKCCSRRRRYFLSATYLFSYDFKTSTKFQKIFEFLTSLTRCLLHFEIENIASGFLAFHVGKLQKRLLEIEIFIFVQKQ